MRARRLVVAVAVVAVLATVTLGHAASLTLTSQTLTPLQTCLLTATPSSTTAEKDAQVDQATPTVNNGVAATVAVQPTKTGAAQRTYVSFSLASCSPAIAASATVRLATLRLNINSLPATKCETEDLFVQGSGWSEAAITWNNQPAGTTLNSPAPAGRTAFAAIGGLAGCTNTAAGAYVPFDVTADVKSWVAGTTTNNGWMLRNDAEAAGSSVDAVAFIAKENVATGRAPQLIITYVS